ncbi:MAG: hypothetical protein ACYS9X_26480 [Planctomycetota bacterium]|jgi:DNA-binding response OmpR family regulator
MTDGRTNGLLVDDEEVQYVLMRDFLSDIEGQEYDLSWAATYEDGLKAVKTSSYDVCIFDYPS